MKKLSLQKWGNSNGIRISKELLKEIGVADSENVAFEVKTENRSIILTPINVLTPFEQLFEGYDETKPKAEYDCDDKPVGKEIL